MCCLSSTSRIYPLECIVDEELHGLYLSANDLRIIVVLVNITWV